MRIGVNRIVTDQKGVGMLTVVLILLIVGGLILTPLLGFMGTGLMTGQVYEESMHLLYAADAGIEDGLWQIRNEQLPILFPNPPPPPDGYDKYAYSDYDDSYRWDYSLGETINGKSVSVTIENVWIPKDIDAPNATAAQQIIETGSLIVAGSTSVAQASTYEIKTTTTCGSPVLTGVGLWLPPGFEYVMGSSDLEQAFGEPYYSIPGVFHHQGGYAVIWDFGSPVSISDFPESFAFEYSGPKEQIPAAAVSWLVTPDGYTWDADVTIYRITSTATDPNSGKQMTVEGYTSNVEARILGSAVSGDYYATGNTLMTPNGGPISNSYYRDVLFRETSATVDVGDIPSSAGVDAAWLYWSGWISGTTSSSSVIWGPENCYDFVHEPMDWTTNGGWDPYNGEFRGNMYYDSSGQWLRVWGPNGLETCGDFLPPIMYWDAGSAWESYGGEFRGNAYDDPSDEWQRIWGLTGPETCGDFGYPIMNWDYGSAWQANGEFVGNGYDLEEPTGNWQRIWPLADLETCEDFDYPVMNWVYGSAWIANGQFVGNGYDLEDPTGEWQVVWGPETCEDPIANWDYGSAWQCYSGEFRGRGYYSGTYLTMGSSIPLLQHAEETVQISWQYRTSGDLEDTDCLYLDLSRDNGNTWVNQPGATRCGDRSTETRTYEIPTYYLTDGFRMRFRVGFSRSDEYCYIDNIRISVLGEPPPDPRYLAMGSSIDFTPYAGEQVRIFWDQHESGAGSYDCLRYSFSNDNGQTWSSEMQAFCGDIGSTPQAYNSADIPASYLNEGFRMRFYLDGFSGTNYYGNPDEYCYIDNIQICVLGEPPPDPRYLAMGSSINLTAYAGQQVRIFWDQHESGAGSYDCLRYSFSNDNGQTWSSEMQAFCGDIGSTPQAYNSADIPASYLNEGFRMRFYLDGFSGTDYWGNPDEYCYIDNIQISVHNESSSSPGRYLTMGYGIDLSAYAGKRVRISWDQREGPGYLGSSDCLRYAFSADNGTDWSSDYTAFCDDIGSTARAYNSVEIPATYLTGDFRMRFYLDGFSDSDDYCYIDNIGIFVHDTPPAPGGYLTMLDSIDLRGHTGQTVEISWDQREGRGDLESDDCLRYDFSADNGTTWVTQPDPAFCNDIGSTQVTYTYEIPASYLTDGFRMRFHLSGFSGTDSYGNPDEYCYIDNIIISAALPLVENARVNRVMFGTTDNMTEIYAETWQTKATPDSGARDSWSYSCYRDVTETVQNGLDPDTNSGSFSLGHVLEGSQYTLYDPVSGSPSGATDYPLATPALSTATQYQWTYAGWSLLIIYSSPETKGHQLYLFDTFRYVGLNTMLTFSITNFLAPDDTTGSHLTYFVGEGDNHYTSDYIKVNGYLLPQPGDPYEDPPVNPQNNVFNSYSNSLDDPYLSGIDIDTFDMSGCIAPADSTAQVILDNGEEIYNLVYIVLSFRSLVTSGGVMGYLITG